MKKIYVLLTKSRTIISKLISLTTNDKYTHVSIAFNEDLYPMYGFSRKYIHFPLPANIQIEPLDSGFYKKYNSIPCALYEIEVSDKQFKDAKLMVEQIFNNKKDYSFNVIGLILCRLGIKFERKNKFFCSQFVSKVLTEKSIIKSSKPPSLIRPADFTTFEELQCLFEGKLYELNNVLTKNLISTT